MSTAPDAIVAAVLADDGELGALTLDLNIVVQTVTDEATRLVEAQFGAFFYNQVDDAGESYSLYTLSGAPRDAFAQFPMPRNTAVFGPTFSGSGIVRSDDITKDPRYGRNAPYHGMPPGHLPVRSYLAVPVTSSAGKPLGGLFFGHPEPGRFTAEHERIVADIARRASVAIENAQLYGAERTARARADAAREQAERGSRRALLIQQLTAALSRALTPDEIARVLEDEAFPALGVKAGLLAVRETEPETGDDVMRTLLLTGLEPPLATAGLRFKLDAQGVTAAAVRRGEPIYITRSTPEGWQQEYPETAAAAAATGSATICALPLLFDGAARGVLTFSFGENREVDLQERVTLESFAAQCAQALERARLFAAERDARAHLEQVNRELQRTITELEAVLEVVPIGIGIARDPECNDIRVNAAFATQLGVDRDVNASKSGPEGAQLPFRVLDDQGREVTAEDLPMQRAARERRTLTDLELNIVHQDGRVVRLLEYAAPLLDETETVRGAVGAFIDITERTRLVEAERAARAEAERANLVKAQFLASMSHELRTPLNAIGGYVELLDLGVQGPVTEAQRNWLARIRRSSEHLLALINDVLNFAQLEAGRVRFQFDRVPVAHVLRDVAGFIAPQAEAAGHALQVTEPAADVSVWADAERVTQILVNLLSNAVKYTPAGGVIEVRCETGASDDAKPIVHVRVIDTGIGIEEDRLEEVFEPFVQVGRELNRPAEGVGLGLAISRDLARRMEGDVTVVSRPQAGSIFTLTLPASRESARGR